MQYPPSAAVVLPCCARTVVTSRAEDLFGALDIGPHVSASAAVRRVRGDLVLVPDIRSPPTVETHAWHGTLNPSVAVVAGRNASYGSQRPVVWFAVARGQ